MIISWMLLAFGALFLSQANAASNASTVRDLAGRVGPIVGSAIACPDIGRARIQVIADKFQAVIRDASGTETERDELTRLLDRYVVDGQATVTSGRTDCKAVERQLSQLEQSLAGPSVAGMIAPSPAAAATAPAAPASAGAVRGVTDREIRFGMVLPYSGARKEAGRQMKLGIEAAFNAANDAGGVNGRMLRLVAADDGYEPTRTPGAMKQLIETEQVFGFVGNIGTATSAAGIPYALERRTLFFGPFTGANVVRNNPPDRYIFNYRASYAEETGAIVNYLVKLRHLQAKQIAVFAQQDPFGDDGFAGVAKAFRSLNMNDAAILKLTYPRNTIDVDAAVNLLRAQKTPVRAIIMVATDRAAAKFIEKTRNLFPDLIYANVSAVGATSLAHELMLLGPRFTKGVLVTQGVPAATGYSSLVLEYKGALDKYFRGEAADYTSLEGYISASILILALKRTGRDLDTEKLVDTLEGMRDFDLGLGAPLNFGRAEHQASHKIWGTTLDETGTYQAIELE